jgi:hypothetical protein
MRKRRRCPYCRCLFVPDARVATRQWACTSAACQVERRRETQRRCRRRHPEDRAARRLRAELAEAKAGQPVAVPSGPPPELARFPWAELRDEISREAFVITSVFVRLVVVVLRDVIRAQAGEIHQEMRRLPRRGRKDPTALPTMTG